MLWLSHHFAWLGIRLDIWSRGLKRYRYNSLRCWASEGDFQRLDRCMVQIQNLDPAIAIKLFDSRMEITFGGAKPFSFPNGSQVWSGDKGTGLLTERA
jgi:hypothetical protein